MKTSVTVRYVSGREEKFEMEIGGGTGAQGRLQALVEKPNLLLQIGDELLVIPGSAIECISIKLPKGDRRFGLADIHPATRIK